MFYKVKYKSCRIISSFAIEVYIATVTVFYKYTKENSKGLLFLAIINHDYTATYFNMEFKIDTKESYVLITPVTNHLNANLTDELCQKCNELTERGSLNFIIDLHNCIEAENEAFNGLTALHESCYNNNQSLVFTCLQDSLLKLIKADNMDGKINITPTVVEAVDIISMEILERDLFDEE